ncbi:uncharacterized protein BCR38DRAFT_414793 [Pseudomassariella vexata]|uniref:Cyanovirin-N domain-containing protein n=1 Tax=Pseudomassariella vexata TaxID=1141098 RepID=A0A1Y2D9K5_9PEZI|nr:uncharacterized protein BCR38DRAFT_414793 [Pseudomassariella vexata]ORY55941.1 hypothetical protein BCR38DRAFT_414793 [Pseudomassariella vexata]
MRIFAFAVAALLSMINSVATNYASSCSSPAIVQDSQHQYLEAACLLPSFVVEAPQSRCSMLDLNLCYGFIDGQIKAEDGGNFSTQCDEHSIRMDGSVVRATCTPFPLPGDTHPGKVQASIDTDPLIMVDDMGMLVCLSTFKLAAVAATVDVTIP